MVTIALWLPSLPLLLALVALRAIAGQDSQWFALLLAAVGIGLFIGYALLTRPPAGADAHTAGGRLRDQQRWEPADRTSLGHRRCLAYLLGGLLIDLTNAPVVFPMDLLYGTVRGGSVGVTSRSGWRIARGPWRPRSLDPSAVQS